MKKGLLWIFGFSCVMSFFAIGCDKGAKTETPEGTDSIEITQGVDADLQQEVTQIEQEAEAVKLAAEQEAQAAKLAAEQEAQQAQAEAEAKAGKIEELLAQAQEFINSENYDQAISTAQVILSQYDPTSTLAKNIIESAQVAMQKAAEEQVGSMTGELKDKIGGLGL